MKHTWYVTFEVPPDGTLLRRRHPRLTKTFETEAEAKDFARTKFNDGLIVTAGTIIPHLPRMSIPSAEIPAWLEARAKLIQINNRLSTSSDMLCGQQTGSLK